MKTIFEAGVVAAALFAVGQTVQVEAENYWQDY